MSTGSKRAAIALVLLACIGLLASWQLANAQAANNGQTAIISYVIDGDTIITNNNKRIRLFGIDAAELETKQGQQARTALVKLVYQKLVRYLPQDVDKYGRIVARVFLTEGKIKGEEVNQLLLDQGVAQEYCYFSHNTYGGCD